MNMRRLPRQLLATFIGCMLLFLSVKHAHPQEIAPNIRLLDREADRLQQDFLSNLQQLAQSYEAAGETAKATQTLRKILDIKPDAEGVKEKLKELDNRVFETNSATVDVDVAKGWVPSGLRVEEGRVVRFEAQGSYRYIVNATLGPEGFSTDDPKSDMADRIGTGALMGWVVPERDPKPNPQKRRGDAPDLGRPFPIGTKAEVTPDKTGLLFFRLNLPLGSTSNGKIKVKISGHFSRV